MYKIKNSALACSPIEAIGYTYDELNRLAGVTNIQGSSTYGYDEVGNRASLSYPNGTSQTWSYDTRNRLTATNIYNALGAIVQSFDYTLHPPGAARKLRSLMVAPVITVITTDTG